MNFCVILYADDTVILSENADDLQIALNGMNEYCKENKLTINVTKTKIVILSKGKVHFHPTFKLNNGTVEVVSNYTYLVIVINYNGRFNVAIQRTYKLARKAIFAILQKINTLINLDIDTMLNLFDCTVAPILYYGCEIWGHENISLLEKLQLRFCKILSNVKNSTPNMMI